MNSIYFNKGTSAVSPLYAALTARLMNIYGINEVQQGIQNGGYYRSFLFRDITTGNNVGFNSSIGWDAVTGMGSFKQFTQLSTPSKIIE